MRFWYDSLIFDSNTMSRGAGWSGKGLLYVSLSDFCRRQGSKVRDGRGAKIKRRYKWYKR
jgi:hypothetical protein